MLGSRNMMAVGKGKLPEFLGRTGVGFTSAGSINAAIPAGGLGDYLLAFVTRLNT
jgi:hypothetical protein